MKCFIFSESVDSILYLGFTRGGGGLYFQLYELLNSIFFLAGLECLADLLCRDHFPAIKGNARAENWKMVKRGFVLG